MKLTILLLFISVLAFGQIKYTAPRQRYDVRTSVTAYTKPLLSDFSDSRIVCYDAANKLVWIKRGGLVVEGFTVAPYSEGSKIVNDPVVINSTAKYSNVKTQYYVTTNSIPGNAPALSNFWYSIDRCYNSNDSIVYGKRSGQVVPLFVCYPYSPRSAIPVPPVAISGDYYIATNGNDTSGTGAKLNPWRSLFKASKKTYSPGDTLIITAGNYSELNVCYFSTNVKILGEDGAVIYCKNPSNYTISFYSSSVVVGANSVQNITFNGVNYTGLGAISAVRRSNVSITNCSFVKLKTNAVYFANTIPTVTYAQNCSFTHNTVSDCSEFDINGSQGAVMIIGQQYFRCDTNTITLPPRGATPAGFPIKTNYTKNLSIQGNTTNVYINDDNAQWAFNEFWNTQNATIAYNRFRCPVDFAGDYNYSVDFNNNIIGHDTLQSVARVGLILECERDTTAGILIHDNHFKNLQSAISFSLLSVSKFDRISIYRNTISGTGVSGNTYWGEVLGSGGNAGFKLSNLSFYKNTIVSEREANTLNAIIIPTKGTVNNVTIRDNIISGYGGKSITSASIASGTISNTSINYNCLYSGSVSWGGVTPSPLNVSNNITTDPQIDSTFHLTTGSGCIGAGTGGGNIGRY